MGQWLALSTQSRVPGSPGNQDLFSSPCLPVSEPTTLSIHPFTQRMNNFITSNSHTCMDVFSSPPNITLIFPNHLSFILILFFTLMAQFTEKMECHVHVKQFGMFFQLLKVLPSLLQAPPEYLSCMHWWEPVDLHRVRLTRAPDTPLDLRDFSRLWFITSSRTAIRHWWWTWMLASYLPQSQLLNVNSH